MTVTRVHRYRVVYWVPRAEALGTRIEDRYERREQRCIARSPGDAVRRTVPADALSPSTFREIVSAWRRT